MLKVSSCGVVRSLRPMSVETARPQLGQAWPQERILAAQRDTLETACGKGSPPPPSPRRPARCDHARRGTPSGPNRRPLVQGGGGRECCRRGGRGCPGRGPRPGTAQPHLAQAGVPVMAVHTFRPSARPAGTDNLPRARERDRRHAPGPEEAPVRRSKKGRRGPAWASAAGG